MTITALTLTNPGAELGNTSGWTQRSGTGFSAVASVAGAAPHTGSYFFYIGDGSAPKFNQEVDISAYAAVVDGGMAAISASAWHRTRTDVWKDSGRLHVEFYDGTHAFISGSENTNSTPLSWTSESILSAIPSGTRYVRVGATAGSSSGGNSDGYWDDFSLTISDDKNTDYPGVFEPKISQVVAYAVASQTADEARATQIVPLTVSAAETSNGFYNVNVHQVVAYALVKKHGDKRKLRAWTFPQDEHKFYVLQLGNSNGTLVYDTLTQQWARWQSPTYVYWRGEDGCAWEGFNVCCDSLTGKIFKIDPEGRLDYNDTTDSEDTPITSVVVGGATRRMRTNVPCYLAELAVSEGEPPSGIDASSVGLSLRSGDTLGWYDHGTQTGLAAGERLTVRWYGLGLMAYPGRVFEITDTGYARRIDGLNIELGGSNGA